MSTVLIIIFSLLTLIFFHELGHFLFAKKYGVRVEEFGIGIPPRVFGKKVGETIYSLNLIPLGGFVRLYGEDKKIDDERSFSSKPIYQRALIVFGGVAAFFVIAFFIFSAYSLVGVRTLVSEEDVEKGVYENWEIAVSEVVSGSPADEAGIAFLDEIVAINEKENLKESEIRKILAGSRGENVDIKIRRGDEMMNVSLVPREDFAENEGSVGIGMATTTYKKYSLYEAPIQGGLMVVQTTSMIFYGLGSLIYSLFSGSPLPPGMDVGGPVAIVGIGTGAFTSGISDFLRFLGLITVSLAIFNILPIPALDGGRLAFLGMEKIKGKPIPEKVEYGLNAFFFLLLISLMIFITFRDLKNIGIDMTFL